MNSPTTFRRYEIKYRMTSAQAAELKEYMKAYMKGDAFGNSVNYSLYFDTPDFRMIRKSLEKPEYKEKLRFRSYGNAKEGTEIFLELKKKFDGIIYKRRCGATEKQAMDFILKGTPLPKDSQIGREIDYLSRIYPGLRPAFFLSYEREAFFSQTDPNFRMTFDQNIRYRTTDLCLHKGPYGERILPEGTVLLEVKTAGAIPLWLTHFLSSQKLYPVPYSKIATAYQTEMKKAKRAAA